MKEPSPSVRSKEQTGLKRSGAEKPASKRARKYLTAKFTRQLVQHMHQAKQAALGDGE